MAHLVTSIDLPTGVTLQYVEQGSPSGVPLLLVPGGYDSWRSYERVLPLLPDSMHAFALTQRGHGDSSKPKTGYRVGDYAKDVAEFMDALGIKAAFFTGHSLSTLVAQRFAIDHPGRTLGLILVGADYSVANNPALEDMLDMFSRLKDPVSPDFVRDFQKSTIAQPLPQEFLETIMQESLKIPARTWKAVFKGILMDDITGELGTIKAPTLLIWGERDELTPRSEQEALLKAIPDARLLVYEGHGHSPHWEAPERFASDLTTFIETVVQ